MYFKETRSPLWVMWKKIRVHIEIERIYGFLGLSIESVTSQICQLLALD